MDELLANFHDNVALKYALYNSLFLTLPFQKMQEVGTLLTWFAKHCAQEIQRGQGPREIVDSFFAKNLNRNGVAEKNNILFTMLQFVERQIVLFDALEDAAFLSTHALNGPGTLSHLIDKITNTRHEEAFVRQIQDYRVKIVLTAHPTQFYPYPVLGIITQLTQAIQNNQLHEINALLWQMGKTSFKRQRKPTPLEEAQSLLWYIQHVFYPVVPQIHQQVQQALRQFRHPQTLPHPVVELGFWPGGDRDGNPHVDSQATLAVANLLKTGILKMYAADLHELSKKLTFKGVLETLSKIRHTLDNTLATTQSSNTDIYSNAEALINDLLQLRHTLIIDHDSLFLEKLDNVLTKVHCFGFYFAAMDMRENAPVHRQVFKFLLNQLNSEEFKNYERSTLQKKIDMLRSLLKNRRRFQISMPTGDSQSLRTLQSIAIIKNVQKTNGEKGLCRYVISNTQSVLDVLELLVMLYLAGNFSKNIPVDIVPLFETINDLENCAAIMQELYQCDFYIKHLANRNNTQTIMLGFSDGTKDGGYISANWSIYKAKLILSKISAQHGIKVIFFDGRGGPPARGGGNTHNFYRSLGSDISRDDLQLTIQGQTVSSNFGTPASAKFNLEQLFTAGIEDLLFPEAASGFSQANLEILQQLADESLKVYQSLKDDPLFVSYLEEMTPLKFYGELNVGSRPTSRSQQKGLKFSDLRAIPFVGSWNQLKQNIPGYYGFGSGLQKLIAQGNELLLKKLYRESLFFRTLVENTMMSLCKTFFPLTAYMRNDKKFGPFWQRLHDEAKLTQILLEKISGQNSLLEKDPLNRESIKMREEIVLPLLIIQQYAMIELKSLETKHPELAAAYKEMVLKALAANTNASRNSA